MKYMKSHFGIEKELYKLIREMAQAKNKSMSSVVRKILWKAVAEWKGDYSNGRKYYCRNIK